MRLYPESLATRVVWSGAAVTGALLTLIALLVSATYQTRRSFNLVSHTHQVMLTIDEAVSDLREAESGQRGFLLTHDPDYARSFDAALREAAADGAALRELVRDNPAQQLRAKALQRVMAERVAALRVPLALARQGRFEAAAAAVAKGHGRALMEEIADAARAIKVEERRLLAIRIADVDRRSSWNLMLVQVGGPGIVLLLVVAIAMLVLSIRRPIAAMLRAMAAFGAGDRTARVTMRVGSNEFRGLADGYNLMVDRLDSAMGRLSESDDELQRANAELVRRSHELAARGTAIELLGGMAHRMQAARTDEELAAVVLCFAPQVLPGGAGALYAHNHSRNMLVRLVSWGAPADAVETFAPGDCWGLRRGQTHEVAVPGSDVVCAHVADPAIAYRCEPLLAAGEVIGMVYLEGEVAAETRFRLAILAENVASALTNLRLQRDLREQTIRDPLTGLFNRRYMEEALGLEIARAMRHRSPLCVVMCDVDHFKRFNDEFGHDAGDALLRALSAELVKYFREGDIVCRYGGEEFTIIAPGVEPATLAARIDVLRERIAGIAIRHAGVALGAVSMSFGVAGWTEDMARDGSSLVRAADAALYRAKRAGRNRTIIAEQAAA